MAISLMVVCTRLVNACVATSVHVLYLLYTLCTYVLVYVCVCMVDIVCVLKIIL